MIWLITIVVSYPTARAPRMGSSMNSDDKKKNDVTICREKDSKLKDLKVKVSNSFKLVAQQ